MKEAHTIHEPGQRIVLRDPLQLPIDPGEITILFFNAVICASKVDVLIQHARRKLFLFLRGLSIELTLVEQIDFISEPNVRGTQTKLHFQQIAGIADEIVPSRLEGSPQCFVIPILGEQHDLNGSRIEHPADVLRQLHTIPVAPIQRNDDNLNLMVFKVGDRVVANGDGGNIIAVVSNLPGKGISNLWVGFEQQNSCGCTHD